MLIHPDWDSGLPVPMVLWMHGRTVNKEIDPGRYLRWMRAGIAACAVDLPGHGERFDPTLQEASRSFEVVRQMIDEIDHVLAAVDETHMFDLSRLGIGGMSAGGMAALARLCDPHPFVCASVEATTGSWLHQRDHQRFRTIPPDEVQRFDPIERLNGWPEIPFQAIHARLDEWVPIEGQTAFVEALRARYRDPSAIEFVVFDRTGAPNEHSGFGKFASVAKDAQRNFFQKWLAPLSPSPPERGSG